MKRIASIDALRGFDMFWIMGMEELVAIVSGLCGYPSFEKLFGHVPWDGLHFMDTVFPTFLFLAGATFPFSAASNQEKGMSRGKVALRVLKRGLLLMLLGLAYNGLFRNGNWATFRIPSVLGYIGFGWMVASWIYLMVRNVWVRVALAVGILSVVTLFFGHVIAPDVSAVVIPEGMKDLAALGNGPFTPLGNFGCYLDRAILGRHSLTALFDNEGFAGLLPTVVTAMLGMFAGEIIRKSGSQTTGGKVLPLLACGAACLVFGLLLSASCPVVKNLWSPSFVLVAGGYSFAMLALFYWIVDVRGKTGWCFFFRVIGMNSITIYMARRIIDFGGVSRFFLGGIASLLPGAWGKLILALGYIAACWLFLFFLHRKNVYLKI